MLSLNQDLYNFVLVFYLFFNEILTISTSFYPALNFFLQLILTYVILFKVNRSMMNALTTNQSTD